MTFELKDYTLGEIISKGFNLYFNNFIILILSAFFVNLPVTCFELIYYFTGDLLYSGNYNIKSYIELFIVVFNLLMFVYYSIFLTRLQGDIYLKNQVDLKSIFKYSINRFFPFLFLILIQYGLYGAVFGLITFLTYKFFLFGILYPGFFFIYFYTFLGWVVSWQSLVMEKKGAFYSLKRSWILTKGRKAFIFAFISIYLLIVLSIIVVAAVLLGVLLSYFESDLLKYIIFKNIFIIFFTPLFSIFFMVLYYDLRIVKEGFSVEHLVHQFNLPERE